MKKALEYREISKGFDVLTFNHSFDAYSDYSINEIINMIDNMNSDWEICTTFDKQYIGRIGIKVKGEVLVASNWDLHSLIEEDGHRYIDEMYADNIIDNIEDINIHGLANSEVIVRNYTICGVWIEENYYIDHMDELSVLEDKYEITIIKDESNNIDAMAWFMEDEW